LVIQQQREFEEKTRAAAAEAEKRERRLFEQQLALEAKEKQLQAAEEEAAKRREAEEIAAAAERERIGVDNETDLPRTPETSPKGSCKAIWRAVYNNQADILRPLCEEANSEDIDRPNLEWVSKISLLVIFPTLSNNTTTAMSHFSLQNRMARVKV